MSGAIMLTSAAMTLPLFFAETRCHKAWMQCIDGYSGSFQAAGQFHRKQDIR